MSDNLYQMEDEQAFYAEQSRSKFLNRVYLNLLFAIMAFVGLEILFFKTDGAVRITNAIMGQEYGFMMLLGAFMIVGWFATRIAHTAKSILSQYLALGTYVVAEAIIFAPILMIADMNFPEAIANASYVTIAGFIALTFVVFITGKDFSFLRGILVWGFACAFGAIIASLIFGFAMGTWFSVLMVAFAGAAILFDTSNILHHYPEDRAVGAALQLFASVALMFWYVLRLFMSRD